MHSTGKNLLFPLFRPSASFRFRIEAKYRITDTKNATISEPQIPKSRVTGPKDIAHSIYMALDSSRGLASGASSGYPIPMAYNNS